MYGTGEGFGNKVSIQTVAIVKAALAMRRVYKVDEGAPVSLLTHLPGPFLLAMHVVYGLVSTSDNNVFFFFGTS